MSIRVRVACIAVQDNRIVLMKKLVPSYHTYNQLTPPGGGVELLETLEQAAVRELYEETGLTLINPVLAGVVSYINHKQENHAITFFFKSGDVLGELEAKESHKHVPEWVQLEQLEHNEFVPEYYRVFIRAMLSRDSLLNARIEWSKDNGALEWSIV